MRRLIGLIIATCLVTLTTAAVARAQVPGGQEESVCFGCHESEMVRPGYRKVPEQWRGSWHARHDVSCHDCHGGDPADAVLSMSPERGFVGVPSYRQVPEFCGKCHIGILKNFLDSGHGKALTARGTGPNCVVCHGSHTVQKASIDIIDEKRCTKCHSYERARTMKQALALTEKRISELEGSVQRLQRAGVFTKEEDKELFRITADFRTLFHTVDVGLVKEKTDSYAWQLGLIDNKVKAVFKELESRRNFSTFLLILFGGMGVVAYLIAKTYMK
jgi:hypothetical protein